MDAFRLLTRGSGRKAGAPPLKPVQTAAEQTISSGKKRKRSEYESPNNGTDSALSVDEIRKLQSQHKIKITNLRALHNQDDTATRKAQKEASRLYPQPLQSFSALKSMSVNHALMSNLADQGFKEPTEVQLATIPLLLDLDEREPDLLVVAPTGSGKTLAFMIPLINKIHQSHRNVADDTSLRQVSTIILAPTKELVTQIVNEGRKLATNTGVRITAFKKGMRLHDGMESVEPQDSEDSEGDAQPLNRSTMVKADIIVSTPLSLVHAITTPSSEEPLPLPHIRNLVFDEADVLLDPLFRDQTISLWSACTNPQLRSSLWSATIGSNIEELTTSTISSRQKALEIKSKQRPPLLRCIIGLKDTSLPNINHKLIYASTEAGKLTGLRNIIRPSPPSKSKTGSTQVDPILRPPFLIFTQTIKRAQSLHDELQYDIPPSPKTSTPDATTNPPSRIAVLHSSLSNTARSQLMTHFRLGKIWILITTDLLSRGIDFRGINAVINYDIPTTSASYVHRAGRTGRAGRKGGACITLYTKDDVAYLRPIVNIIRKSGKLRRVNTNGEVNRSSSGSGRENEVPSWLVESLPYLTKQVKKDLKERGVDVRRGVKESDNKKERRSKARNTIGTKSGYEKKLEDRKREMVEGSRRRKVLDTGDDGGEGGDGEDFTGFD